MALDSLRKKAEREVSPGILPEEKRSRLSIPGNSGGKGPAGSNGLPAVQKNEV